MELKKYLNYLETWLQKTVSDSQTKGLIVGLSGGVDSALTSALIAKAFPNNHLVLMMPCHSNELDVKLAKSLVKKLNLNSKIVNLDAVYDAFMIDNKISNLASGNLKARLRMATLYAYAQTNNYLVVGTDNACEWHTGYFTKYGDGGIDIAPLLFLNKNQVRQGASLYGVDDTIVNRVPTAGLWNDQTDEKEMGVTYDQIDRYLDDPLSVSAEIVAKIKNLHKKSNHKRSPIVKPKNIKNI